MVESRFNVLVIGTALEEARRVRETLLNVTCGPTSVCHASQLEDALPLLAQDGFEGVLLDGSRPEAAWGPMLAQLAKSAPAAGVVIMVPPPGLTGALPPGAHAQLVKEPGWELDSRKLTRALDAARRARESGGGTPPRLSFRRRAAITCFLGSGGGLGTTTTAWRTGRELAARGARTVVVELRGGCGGLADCAGVKAAGHLGQLVQAAGEPLSAQELDAALTQTGAHLKLLFAPPGDQAGEEFDGEQTRHLLDALTRIADHVVVDLPCAAGEAMETACAASTWTVLVTGAGAAELRRGRQVVGWLQSWSKPPAHLGAVVLHSAEAAPRPAPLAAALGCDVLAVARDGAAGGPPLRGLVERIEARR